MPRHGPPGNPHNLPRRRRRALPAPARPVRRRRAGAAPSTLARPVRKRMARRYA
jgi:hypothetical protein